MTPRPSASIAFVAFSCQYPAGLVEEPVTYGSMSRLARTLEEGARIPLLTVSLGDLVYVDATAGLFDPFAVSDRFAGPYDRLAKARAFEDARTWMSDRFAALPDDHEMAENWQPDLHDRDGTIARSRGIEAFVGKLKAPVTGDLQGLGRLFPDRVSDASWQLFLADTRLHRERRFGPGIATAHLLHERERFALETWLRTEQRDHGDRPKFVLCPSLVLPRRLGLDRDGPYGRLASDAWDGYPRSLGWLLSTIATHRIANVVFVSGDEHLAMICEARLQVRGHDDAVTVHSVHCPAMHAPYPFANSRPEDFEDDGDTFDIAPVPGTDEPVRCTVVRTLFPPVREGFVLVRATDGPDATVEIDMLDGWNFDAAELAPRTTRLARLADARRARDSRHRLTLARRDG